MLVSARPLGFHFMRFCCVRSLKVLFLVFSIPFFLQGYAAAPVVDDSDNFAVFDDEPVKPVSSRAKVQEEEPLAKAIPENKSRDLSLPGQVQALQQEIQALRGELEVQAHALKQLEQQQLAFYKDIDTRLRGEHLPATQPTTAAAVKIADEAKAIVALPVNTAPHAINPADEQIAYLAAYDLVKTKRYPEALIAMQSFAKQYPVGGYTANAEYWIGELYLAKNMPMDAMGHFEIVLKQFPTSSKAAASALKLGYALNALGRRAEARQRLQEVIKNYPDTSAAQLAKTKLQAIE